MYVVKRLGWLFAALLIFSSAAAQVAAPLDSSHIGQRLDRLSVLGSVLYIAAHPDDENTQLLAWLSQQKRYRTSYLSLTRGDGGQNLIGAEQGPALGIIRTHELLAARREDGAEQYFSRANDFGFSKSADETIETWNHEQALADVVWLIRSLQPDVIITRFPDDRRAGHGHHQASSRLASEAFRAAADPQRFPEQLQYVKPWQPHRLMWNTWLSFLDSGSTRTEDQLRIDVGGYNPRLGHSYGEIAALSRNHHKSQGFGSRALRGHIWETFALLDGEPAQGDLFSGIDTSWSRIPQAQAIASRISDIQRHYNPADPSASVPALLTLRTALASSPTSYWHKRKLQEVDELILACAGIWVQSYASQASYSLGDPIEVRTELVVRSKVPVALEALDGVAHLPQHLPMDERVEMSSTLRPTRISQPYWLERPYSDGHFEVQEQQLVGQPVDESVTAVRVQLRIAGHALTLLRNIQYLRLDPLRGEVTSPVRITPAATVSLDTDSYLFGSNEPKQLQINVKGHATNFEGTLVAVPPQGWKVTPVSQHIRLAAGEERLITVSVHPPTTESSARLRWYWGDAEEQVVRTQTLIEHSHIPSSAWYPETTIRLVRLDLKQGGRRIGYIRGAGDKLPDILRQLDYRVDELDDNVLLQGDLSAYDAIVTGIRAYNVNPKLPIAQPRLLNYVAEGGVLLTQYNTLAPPPSRSLWPYPLEIGRDRVTQERSQVRLLLPQHPLLNHPNTISARDFDGWVQERGLYFPSLIDPRYQRLLGMHDDGEDELTGSLVSIEVGKGRFIYTSLSFFRQLPAGVPGAARLFANLLAR